MRTLERGGDHAVDICELASFLVTGEFKEPQIVDLNDSIIAYDLNYSINDTPFCKWAKSFTEKNFDGTGMLVHQAAKSFKLWTGEEAPVEVMRKAALDKIEKKR